jgi:hypothetical protein
MYAWLFTSALHLVRVVWVPSANGDLYIANVPASRSRSLAYGRLPLPRISWSLDSLHIALIGPEVTGVRCAVQDMLPTT